MTTVRRTITMIASSFLGTLLRPAVYGMATARAAVTKFCFNPDGRAAAISARNKMARVTRAPAILCRKTCSAAAATPHGARNERRDTAWVYEVAVVTPG